MPEDIDYGAIVQRVKESKAPAASGAPAAAPSAAPTAPSARPPFMSGAVFGTPPASTAPAGPPQPASQRDADYVFMMKTPNNPGGFQPNPMNPNKKSSGWVTVFKDGKTATVNLDEGSLPLQTKLSAALTKPSPSNQQPMGLTDAAKNMWENDPQIRMTRKFASNLGGMASGTYHALTDAPRESDKVGGYNLPYVPTVAKRMFVDPSIAEYQKFKDAPDAAGKIQHGLGMVPIAGPMGSSISSTLQNQGAPEALGEAASYLAAPAIVDAALSPVDAARTILGGVTTPESLMGKAAELRQSAATPRPPLQFPTSLTKAGIDLLNVGSRKIAPIWRAGANERLASFMTAGDKAPPGTPMQIPDMTGENGGPRFAPMDATDYHSSLRPADAEMGPDYRRMGDAPPRTTDVGGLDTRSSEQFGGGDVRSFYGQRNKMRAEAAAMAQEKLGTAITEHRLDLERTNPGPAPQLPGVLDAPSINKWMGVRAGEVMRGADPGARMVSEQLMGVDKPATAAKVKTALGEAGRDLESALEKADEKATPLNVKSIIDDATADANKPFGGGTDESFQKQIDQISTDALNEVGGNLKEVNPSNAHALKVRIGKAIDWNAKITTPYQAVLKRIFRDLNDGLGKVNSDIQAKQSRWGDLYIADKSLRRAQAADVVGRGSGAQPKLRVPENVPTKVGQPYVNPDPPSSQPTRLP